jgi:hypothetical protein
VLYDDVWEPGRPLAARCEHGHFAPDARCACGIYAARDPAEARRYMVGRDEPNVVGRVLGRVFLWGVVVEGKYGWRGELAYPAQLDSDVAVLYGAEGRGPGRRDGHQARPVTSAALCRTTPRSTSCARKSRSATARS